MSSTNKTPYYELPQYISTDIPTYLGDFNGAMSIIDTALKSNADRADLATTNAGQAVNTANAAADGVSAMQTSMAGLSARMTSAEETNAAQSTQISANAGQIDSLGTRVTALEQSGGGSGKIYLVGAGGIDTMTNPTTATTVTGQAQRSWFESKHTENKTCGVIVEISVGNSRARQFVPKDDFYNAFDCTFVVQQRVFNVGTGFTCGMGTINIGFGAMQSDGSRSIIHISSVYLNGQPAGPSTPDTAKIIARDDGIYSSTTQFSLSMYAIVLE